MSGKGRDNAAGHVRDRRMAALAEAYGWQCHYCHRHLIAPGTEHLYCRYQEGWCLSRTSPVSFPTLDHKIPRAKGGTHETANLVLCCTECNSRKGARHTYEEFYAMTAELRTSRPEAGR